MLFLLELTYHIMMKKINLGIVGVTGLVGGELIDILDKSNIEISLLRVFASSKSKGKIIKFRSKKYKVKVLEEGCFDSLDVVLFTCGKDVSKVWVKEAIKSNCYVIDNSSYFRLDDDVCLLIPEVNDESFHNQKIISNPNCSTIQSVLAIKCIDDLFGINKIIYNTYQSVSGGGKKLVDELDRVLKGKHNVHLPYNLSKSLIPEIDTYTESGYTKEEMKMALETKKIFNRNDLIISATCVRVPIKRTHAVSIYVECDKETDIDLLKEMYFKVQNIIILDDLRNHIYPVGEIAINNDFVYIGRIRKVDHNPNALLLYVVSDNLRKGAASNMVEILNFLILKNIF